MVHVTCCWPNMPPPAAASCCCPKRPPPVFCCCCCCPKAPPPPPKRPPPEDYGYEYHPTIQWQSRDPPVGRKHHFRKDHQLVVAVVGQSRRLHQIGRPPVLSAEDCYQRDLHPENPGHTARYRESATLPVVAAVDHQRGHLQLADRHRRRDHRLVSSAVVQIVRLLPLRTC